MSKLELKKLPLDTNENNIIDWLRFFKAKNEEEFAMLATKNEEIKKAVVILKELSQDESARMISEYEEKVKRDNRARINGAIKQGIEQGILLIAKKLLAKGKSIDEVVEITELSYKEVESLLK